MELSLFVFHLCSKRMPFRLFPAWQQVHERTAVFLNGLRRQTDFLTIDSALHERHAAAKTASPRQKS